MGELCLVLHIELLVGLVLLQLQRFQQFSQCHCLAMGQVLPHLTHLMMGSHPTILQLNPPHKIFSYIGGSFLFYALEPEDWFIGKSLCLMHELL